MTSSGVTRPDTTVVVVSYNTREVLAECLAALGRSVGVSLEVFVVDNGSRDGSPEMVASTYPAVTLIRNADNRGFAAANNVALARATAPAWLLLNPDTLVRPDTVARLRAALMAEADIGIVGPRVLNGDGSLQSCGYWYPTLMREIRESKNVTMGLRMIVGDEPPAPDPSAARDVDWVDGCCLMIRRDAAAEVGLLDEQFFLYAEELDWCRTVRRAGWRVRTAPDSQMVHLLGKSSEQVKPWALSLLVETRLRYYRKQDGLLTALVVAFVYVAGCLRRWRHEPDKCRAKLAGVKQWWRALLSGQLRPRVPRVPRSACSIPENREPITDNYRGF
jgi:GT2 family glycosyltransferase